MEIHIFLMLNNLFSITKCSFSFCSHQNYTKLVDNMLKNNLVLKGSFDGFELLIFPSNKLHERFQCKYFILIF